MGLPYAGSVKLWGCLIRKVQVCAEHKTIDSFLDGLELVLAKPVLLKRITTLTRAVVGSN